MSEATSGRSPRIPKLNAPRLRIARCSLIWRWPIHLGNERRATAREELLDTRDRRDKRMRQLGKRRVANNDQQCNAVSHDRIAFVRLVADAAIMRERDPAVLADFGQPDLVRRDRSEVVRVPLDGQPACFENLTESFAEVAVREVRAAHAARS